MNRELSKTYQDAIARHDRASAIYREAARQYRAREIDDDQFITARKAFDKATAEFDAAFAAEQNRVADERRKAGAGSIKELLNRFTFAPMQRDDYDCFAGIEGDGYISHDERGVAILDVQGDDAVLEVYHECELVTRLRIIKEDV